ncbi:MATE family efflux transporter [Porphyromonas sp.]|uniref:MATE family efflux transporter n=1 Tax=Porphyromonas sp. TaxID=1924944 RepID=UPI0026DCC2E5|nr:MATE family efflux transporter [Porphyromonas sp.]MDO4771136.1 MATE family efflux transporter [Porphyromonas sp.]
MSNNSSKCLNRRILTLAIPNILSNITVPLLGIADLALAGRLNDVDAIGGIAIATTIFNLIYWNFAFLRMGTTGMTAQANGAGDRQLIGRLLMQSLMIGLTFGLLILLFQTPLLSGVMALLSPEAPLISYSHKYFYIVVMAAPAVLMTYALNGWIIGMQNTWLPMVVSLTTNVLNIAISAYLVLVARWDIQGIATGTLVAHYVGVVMLGIGAYVLYLKKGKAVLPNRFGDLTVGLGRFFKTNADIFLRTLLLIIVTGFFTYAGTQFGGLTLSTNTLLLQFFTIFSYFTDGFAYAAEALVGLYYGSQDRELLRRVIRYLMWWGVGITIVATALYVGGGNVFLRFLTDKSELITHAQPYMIWVCLVPIAGFLAFLWDGIYIGLTATREMLWSMVAAVAVFFILFFTLTTEDPNHALWSAFLAYLAVRGVLQSFFARGIEGVGKDFKREYYLSIGTDNTVPDHLENIRQLLLKTWKGGEICDFYMIPDATGKSDKVYANTVMRLRDSATPDELSATAKALETLMGRDRTSSNVALDIDVVVCDGIVLRSKDFNQNYFRIGYDRLHQSSN